MDQDIFSEIIWNFYSVNARLFPWRHVADPYKVFVSEIMLQQTQTKRVNEKFDVFIRKFPTFKFLSAAAFSDVLLYWSGLGYNRRALFLYNAAKIIVDRYDSILPNDEKILITLPGIGKATAASICAFAFNQPAVFIETNIRAVFLHHFFPLQDAIDDRQILPLIETTLDYKRPRDWYYALMDYGVHLKKTVSNPSRKSKHHTKQSKFEGSDRQIRGEALRLLLEYKQFSLEALFERVSHYTDNLNRFNAIIDSLVKDGLVQIDQLNRIMIVAE